MEKIIPIKEFRAQLAHIADDVAKGHSYTVLRRSKKAFKVVPADMDTDSSWETVVDFTEEGTTKGAAVQDVLKALQELIAEDADGQD